MGSLVHQHQGFGAGFNPDSFLERGKLNQIDRQPLVLGFADRLMTTETQSIFAGRKPIFALRKAAVESEIRFAVEAAHKLRPQLGMVVKESFPRCGEASSLQVENNNLSLPLGFQQIPVGLELA